MGELSAVDGSRHIVVIGGGVREQSKLFRTFHREVFQQECGQQWPNMAIMAKMDMPVGIKELILKSPLYAQCRTFYFVGDPLSSEDGKRVKVRRAKMCVVMANRMSPHYQEEDSINLMRALAIKEQRPD